MSNINPPTEIFCSTGCVQYQPGRLSDIQEMINCCKIKSDRRAAGGIFARQRGTVTVMSHAAESPPTLTFSLEQRSGNKLVNPFVDFGLFVEGDTLV